MIPPRRRFAGLLPTFLAGAAASLALPPFSLFLLIFPGLSWLVLRVDRAAGWRWAFLEGLCFGFAYFLVGLYWVGISFTHLEHPLAPVSMVGAVAGLVLALAVFTAVPCAVAKFFWVPGSPARVVTFSSLWCLGEWIRSCAIPTPFSWHLVAQASGFSLPILQTDAAVGPFDLSFLLVIVGASPVLFGASTSQDWVSRLNHVTRGFLTGLAILGLMFGLGYWRLVRASARAETRMTDIRLRLVQPNIPQSLRMDVDDQRKAEILDRLISMSTSGPALPPGSIIIWPETAWPHVVRDDESGWVGNVMRRLPAGVWLVTGLERVRFDASTGRWEPLNSVFFLGWTSDGQATVSAVYDKVDLVPFGEYLPGRDWLRRLGLKSLVAESDFSKGDRRFVVSIDEHTPPLTPLVCYEVTFAHRIQPSSWLLNVTNDAWFGYSSGPYQHLFQARMRAVEQGVPVVRVANSGVTAIIGPYGDVLGQISLSSSGVLDGFLPRSIDETLYRKWGNTLFFLHISLWFIYIAGLKWFKLQKREV